MNERGWQTYPRTRGWVWTSLRCRCRPASEARGAMVGRDGRRATQGQLSVVPVATAEIYASRPP